MAPYRYRYYLIMTKVRIPNLKRHEPAGRFMKDSQLVLLDKWLLE